MVSGVPPMARLPAAAVRGRTVDGGDLTAHGAEVRRELPAVVDGVEEQHPDELARRLLQYDLAPGRKLRRLRPPRLVHRGDAAHEVGVVLLEGGDDHVEGG